MAYTGVIPSRGCAQDPRPARGDHALGLRVRLQGPGREHVRPERRADRREQHDGEPVPPTTLRGREPGSQVKSNSLLSIE